MKSLILAAYCILFATQAEIVSQPKLTPQEAFFLRRMTEFWKDKDYGLVKKQIEEFLGENETSNIHNNLYALMGDILYRERDYVGALAMYHKISDSALMEKVLSRKAQCLYLSENYDEVIEHLGPLFKQNKKIDYQEEMQFILADSLFRKMRKTSDSAVQQQLCVEVKPLLLELFNTSYQDKVLLALAEVHRELKEPDKAAPLYLLLADKMPTHKEELLLQAAVLQMEYEPALALANFQQLVDLGGSKAQEAAYQELLLLFQNDRSSDLISRAPKIEMYLNEGRKNLLEFCLARSYFKLDQLLEAIQHLNRFIVTESDPTPHKKAAFLTLIHCAQKTDNQPLFDQAVAQFLRDFPLDEEAGKALLLHAQTALQRGELMQAIQDLNRLLKDFPNFPNQETLLYDQAVLLCKTEQWGASRTAFLSYLEKFSSSPQSNLIWASIVHSSVQELKESSEENKSAKKEQLAADLTKALTFSNVFSLEEEAAYRFLLGQLLFELDRFSESVVELDLFCQKYPEHPSAVEAYFLQALSHRALNSSPELFIPAAEKALALLETSTHKTALHLQLFNAYLALKEYDKAAEKLYQTFIIDKESVHQENQLWLANYYLDRADLTKSMEVFKKVLVVDEAYQLHFDPAHTYLETEALKFAKVLGPSDQEKLLRSLMEIQIQHPQLPWKHQGSVFLALGVAYLQQKKAEDALATFDSIIAKGDEIPSSIRNLALLEKSRLLLAGCQLSEQSEEHPTIRMALSTFKDLQIQKQLSEEPVHLEAAFDYAALRTALAPEAIRVESALFFLGRIKEDFNAKEDSINQEYHEARLRYPEKDHLYQIYMKYLEAEILYWEAKEAFLKNDMEKMEKSKKLAMEFFEEIVQDVQSTSYVKNRARERLTELHL